MADENGNTDPRLNCPAKAGRRIGMAEGHLRLRQALHSLAEMLTFICHGVAKAIEQNFN